MIETSSDASRNLLKTFHLQGKKRAGMTFFFCTFTLFSNQRGPELQQEQGACNVAGCDKAADKPSAFHSSIINMNN